MLFNVDIASDGDYLGTVEGIEAADPQAACDDPQVWQYVEQLRDDYPNAMADRAVAVA
jgi:hypothetical protein